MQPLRFVPVHELADTPNVIVDGSPVASTRLTLSHWPGSPTPAHLLDDLSAQIAFRAVDRPEVLDGIGAVSNNHFDQDGLASAFALVDPDGAMSRRGRVIDVARAGDFGTFEHRESIRLAFALAALDDPDRSTLDPAVFIGDDDERCGRLYQELLPRFAELIDHPERTRRLWEAEDAHLDESIAGIDTGQVGVREDPALDLVTVTVPDDWAERMTSRFTIARSDAVHPAAINRFDRFRVVVHQGRRHRVELRYESWVMYRSRPVLPRPDLRVLAVELNELEAQLGGTATWTADAPGALTPGLRHDGESGVGSHRFDALLAAFLGTAPPAWDPMSGR